jgi:hypothetical protein
LPAPQAREKTTAIHRKLYVANKRDSLVKHAIGRRVTKAVRNMATYGQDFATELNVFLGLSADYKELGNMKTFATEYPMQFILEQSAKPLANGAFLTYGHFLELMKVWNLKRRTSFWSASAPRGSPLHSYGGRSPPSAKQPNDFRGPCHVTVDKSHRRGAAARPTTPVTASSSPRPSVGDSSRESWRSVT